MLAVGLCTVIDVISMYPTRMTSTEQPIVTLEICWKYAHKRNTPLSEACKYLHMLNLHYQVCIYIYISHLQYILFCSY